MTKESRLLKRWVFDLSNALIHEGWPRKEAFKQAYLCLRLLVYLGLGTVEFEYYKKDGTVRRARGTLCKGVSKDFDHYEYKTEHQKKNPFGVFKYYDLDAMDFRTFSVTNLIRIIVVVIKNNTL